MALTGNFTKIWYTQSETDFIDLDVTYPSDLPSDDPDYDKRGTTETIQVPENVKNTQEYQNVYIALDWCFHYKFSGDGNGNTLLDFGYRVYESEAQRNSDPDSHILEGDFLQNWVDLSSNQDIRVVAYEILKTKEGFEQLTDS
jgi:hypothetical protein